MYNIGSHCLTQIPKLGIKYVKLNEQIFLQEFDVNESQELLQLFVVKIYK